MQYFVVSTYIPLKKKTGRDRRSHLRRRRVGGPVHLHMSTGAAPPQRPTPEPREALADQVRKAAAQLRSPRTFNRKSSHTSVDVPKRESSQRSRLHGFARKTPGNGEGVRPRPRRRSALEYVCAPGCRALEPQGGRWPLWEKACLIRGEAVGALPLRSTIQALKTSTTLPSFPF